MPGAAPRAGGAAGAPSPQRGQGGLGDLGERGASLRGTQGSGYAPADSLGNFRPPTDSDTTDSGQPRVDYDELEYDPSERRPGGPVAEAIWAAGPQARRMKWAVPALAFLAALLLQSAGLHAATQRYVQWMEHLGQRVEGASTIPLELLGPRDRLVSWLGRDDASKLPLDVLAGGLPLLWLGIVLGQRNLRLWTHTLLAGTIIALLKGLCAWVTVVPDPPGAESCFERLHPQVLGHFQHHDSILESIPIVLWLWAQDLIFCMRNQQGLVCAGSFSGPSYACALFSLGLYDASRSRVRKMKPHFRSMYHVASALVLSSIVLADAGMDLAMHRQSTLDVVLALVLPLLLYGSPVVAMATDRFLLQGCSVEPDLKVGCDVGDVVVPPCCMPFCCLHGRYFLHTWPASQVREALRAQAEAKRASEEFRIEQQEAARVSLELEAQLEGVRSRSQARRRQDEAEAERRFVEQAAEAQQASERRLTQELAKLEAETQAERRKAADFEERAAASARRLEELKEQEVRECRRLEEDLAAAKREAEEAKAALKQAKEKATQQALDVDQLRQSVAELGPEALSALEAEAKKVNSDGCNLVYPLTEEALAVGASLVEQVRDSVVVDPAQRVQEVLRRHRNRRCSPHWPTRSGSDELLVCFTDYEPDDAMAIAQLWQWFAEMKRACGPPLVIFQANLQEKDSGTVLEKKQLVAQLMLGLPSYYTLAKDGDTVSDHPQHQGLLDQRQAYLDGICEDLVKFEGSLIHLCVMAPGSGNLAAILGELKARGSWPLRAKWRISMYSGSFNMRGMTPADMAALNEIMACSELPLLDVAKFPFFGGSDCHKWTESLTTFAMPSFAGDLADGFPDLAAALKLFNDEFNARLIEPKKLIKKDLEPEEAARFAKIRDLFDPSDAGKLREYTRTLLSDEGLMDKVPGFKKPTLKAFACGGCDSPLCDQLIFLHEWLSDRRPGFIKYEEGYWRYNEEKAFVEIVESPEGLPHPMKARRPVVASPGDEEHLQEMRHALQDYLMRHLRALDRQMSEDGSRQLDETWSDQHGAEAEKATAIVEEEAAEAAAVADSVEAKATAIVEEAAAEVPVTAEVAETKATQDAPPAAGRDADFRELPADAWASLHSAFTAAQPRSEEPASASSATPTPAPESATATEEAPGDSRHAPQDTPQPSPPDGPPPTDEAAAAEPAASAFRECPPEFWEAVHSRFGSSPPSAAPDA